MKENRNLHKLTSVSEKVFDFLLALLDDYNPKAYSKEDVLLSFLLKLKLDLPFEALAIIMTMSPSTLRSNFYTILEILSVRYF